MNDRERIGMEISSLRKKRNMSIRELADKSGVPYPNICRIENGKFSAGIDTLSRITVVLGAKITVKSMK